ncbi:LOW QUALITY PROTEIN: hypothetical protein JCM19037_2463 [Geomicrobium sp. JCM 19037]|nr:LOW QUALITY PROTEIN: hypothetical protein JCM19037_2463 [Geomicrobium sp. JCM 19037]
MEFRTLQPEEKEQAIQLGEFAFQHRFTDEDRDYLRENTQPENVWGAFDGERLASKVSLLPLNVWLHGVSVKGCGVTGVSTWPEERRGGLVRQLLQRGLKDMKDRGASSSLLDPFSVGYYRKFGWELYCDETIAELKKDEFPTPVKEGNGSFRSVNQEDWQALQHIYAKYAPRFTGMIDRDEWWWMRRKFSHWTKQRRNIIFTNPEGEDRGYVLYSMKDKQLKVSEFVALDDAAERELWRFLANHDSMADSMNVKVANSESWRFSWKTQRLKRNERFLWEELMKHFSLYFLSNSKDDQAFVLKITDQFAAWNDGIFEVSSEGVKRMDDGTNLIEMDVSTLVPLLFGYVNGEHLYADGRMKGEAQDVLNLCSAIPSTRPNLFDAF